MTRVTAKTHILLTGHEMKSPIRFHLAIAEWIIGLPETAASTMQESVAIASQATQPFSLAQALGNSALLHTLSRRWEAAEALASETSEVSVRHRIPDYILFGGMLAATVTAVRGDVTKGAPIVRECMRQLRRAGWQCFVPNFLVHLAAALSASNEVGAALETASEALYMTRANGEFAWESEALRVMGEGETCDRQGWDDRDRGGPAWCARYRRAPGSVGVSVARSYLACPLLDETGKIGRKSRTARPYLWAIHSGARHSGSSRGMGIAQ